MSNLLSRRGEFARDWEDFLVKYLNICVGNPYDEETNPSGYVNLGTSINNVCNDILFPRLTSKEIWSCDTSLLQYKEGHGILRLREVFAKLMTKMLESHEEISPDNLICISGGTACIDLLAHCLADPGDVFLVPTPVYGRIYTDFKQNSQVNIQPVPVIDAHNTEDYPMLTMEKIIKAYEYAIAEKHIVRGLFLINPNNPLGDIYSPQLLMDILTFCNEHSIHIIVDEMYALSVYSETEKFHSILKFPNLPDPERTHVLYGVSKDFGIAGLRVGVIHTKCEPLKKSLWQLSFFYSTPFPVMEIVARHLDDLEWVKMFVTTLQTRLAKKHKFCAEFLQKSGLKVRNSSGGFYLWVDFRDICGSSYEQEMDFFEYLIEKAHLYIGPGKEFFCAQPGWFRIVFTESSHHLKEGMNRLQKAVAEYKLLNV